MMPVVDFLRAAGFPKTAILRVSLTLDALFWRVPAKMSSMLVSINISSSHFARVSEFPLDLRSLVYAHYSAHECDKETLSSRSR